MTDAAARRQLACEGLRAEQAAVVQGVLDGKDVFVALPTGYGKSLCFAVLPYAFDS